MVLLFYFVFVTIMNNLKKKQRPPTECELTPLEPRVGQPSRTVSLGGIRPWPPWKTYSSTQGTIGLAQARSFGATQLPSSGRLQIIMLILQHDGQRIDRFMRLKGHLSQNPYSNKRRSSQLSQGPSFMLKAVPSPSGFQKGFLARTLSFFMTIPPCMNASLIM